MTVVHLVRHAPHGRVSTHLCGRMPGVSLDEAGRQAATALAERLAEGPVGAVLSSPVERARETAEIIARRLGQEVRIEPELVEIDFGAWTGRSFAELNDDPDWQAWNARRGSARPPSGESMAEAQVRIAGLLNRLGEGREGDHLVLVSHGDVIRAGLAAVLGLPLDHVLRVDIDPVSVSTVVLWPGGGRVASLNGRAAA